MHKCSPAVFDAEKRVAARLSAARELYRQCRVLQHAARLVYTSSGPVPDASLVAGRTRFLLDEFPTRFLSAPRAAAPAAAPLTSILSTISSIDASFHQPGGNLVASPQTDKTGQMVGGPWVRASGGVTNVFSTMRLPARSVTFVPLIVST